VRIDDAAELLLLLSLTGGSIRRACDCSPVEIARARAEGQHFAAGDGLAYILLPADRRPVDPFIPPAIHAG
jgi:hypothetical protein